MGIEERKYMTRDHEEASDYDEIPFSEIEREGVGAESQDEAAAMLRFASPTLAANGKWYRTTVAVTNVPVTELYNVLTACNLLGQRLGEIAKSETDCRDEIGRIAERLKDLRDNCNGGQGWKTHQHSSR